MQLANKKVLITGGTRGIGRALAQELHERGAEVLVCGRSRHGLVEVQQALGIRGVLADLTQPAGIRQLTSVVRGELAGLDVLVNNAGVQHQLDLTTNSSGASAEVAINLLAPLALTQELMPLLLASREAALVNVTSALAFATKPDVPVYCATKAALASLTCSWRAQLKGSVVRVVEVVPPLVRTQMTAGRDDTAVSPELVASAIRRGLETNAERIVIGKAKLLSAIHRLSPTLARRAIRGS